MLIIFMIIALCLIVGGALMVRSSYKNGKYNVRESLQYGGIAEIICGGIMALVVIIVVCVLMNNLLETSVVNQRIEMYQQENTIIEGQIETVVKQYQEYESGIITEVGDKESYITLVSLYPDLKADELVNKQIEVYLNNNKTIVGLNNQLLNEKIYRWWLYFGG